MPDPIQIGDLSRPDGSARSHEPALMLMSCIDMGTIVNGALKEEQCQLLGQPEVENCVDRSSSLLQVLARTHRD